MFIYCISSGELTELLEGGKTAAAGYGYSGLGSGKNNARAVHIHGVGPLPPGHYIVGPMFTSASTGPMAMHLTTDPMWPFESYGRGDFEMHGDNATHTASHGCIIMPPWVRKRVAFAQDRELLVIP